MRPSGPIAPLADQRGAALVTAAVVLLMISVIAVAFMSTISGERSMSSNVSIARGSLYAADAGVRAAQQQLANVARSRLDSLYNIYSGTGPVIPAPGGFFAPGATLGSATIPKYSTTTTIAFSDSDLTDTSQVFNFRYRITSNGGLGVLGQRSVQSDGFLRVSASRGSFADYLIFTDIHTMGDGSNIWFTSSGQFDGRVHTNTQFRIAYRPTFEDLISSVNTKAWYYNNGNPIERDANNNGSIDVPSLHGGFERGADNIPLPTNAYNQQNAALGYGVGDVSAKSNSEIRDKLRLPSNSSAPPNGIYLPTNLAPPLDRNFPNTESAGATVTGGIYIQGDVSSFTTKIDSAGRQMYVIVQGSATRTIRIDKAANKTWMSDGTTTLAYTGTPRGIVYDNGSISGLGGPSRVSGDPQPAIVDGNALLITATNDITLSNDIIYNDFEDGGSILGIYSAGGDIRVGTTAPNDMQLDAFVMAAGSNGEFRVDNYGSGSPRGNFQLRGGMVSKYYGAFYTFNSNGTLKTGYGRDFHYDRRGLRPPFYPSTPVLNPDDPSARTLAWKEL